MTPEESAGKMLFLLRKRGDGIFHPDIPQSPHFALFLPHGMPTSLSLAAYSI